MRSEIAKAGAGNKEDQRFLVGLFIHPIMRHLGSADGRSHQCRSRLGPVLLPLVGGRMLRAVPAMMMIATLHLRGAAKGGYMLSNGISAGAAEWSEWLNSLLTAIHVMGTPATAKHAADMPMSDEACR